MCDTRTATRDERTAGTDEEAATALPPGTPHLDLRDLFPPEPLVRILAAIEAADAPDRLVADLDRDPIALYPELIERGWSWRPVEFLGDRVRLTLRRGPAS